jgi:hypothetical protein
VVVENQLPSYAEKRAAQCESLAAFSGLNLLHIRRSVKQLLGLIGRDGIFDEYTIHDISHIDSSKHSGNRVGMLADSHARHEPDCQRAIASGLSFTFQGSNASSIRRVVAFGSSSMTCKR